MFGLSANFYIFIIMNMIAGTGARRHGLPWELGKDAFVPFSFPSQIGITLVFRKRKQREVSLDLLSPRSHGHDPGLITSEA
jgi:hypothetical protein